MSDYETGYKKPPLQTRFKKGVCPNPKGRGAARVLRAGKIFEDVVRGSVEMGDGKKKKRVAKTEYMVRQWAKQALKGDIKSAELLLEVHRISKKYGDYRHVVVAIQEWERPGGLKIREDMTPMEAAEIYERSFQDDF